MRFDPKSSPRAAVGRIEAVDSTPPTAGDLQVDRQAPLGPLEVKAGLGSGEQLVLVDNLTVQLERVASLLSDAPGRADALVRQLARQAEALQAALRTVTERDDPDAGRALRALGQAVAQIEGGHADLEPLLTAIGALPGIDGGVKAGRARTQMIAALAHSARFMAAGRKDLAQLADRFAARMGKSPFYEARARLREIDAHREAGRPEFAAFALDRLEGLVKQLDANRVRRLKPMPEDPAGDPPTSVDDLKAQIARLRADLNEAAPVNDVAGHEAILAKAEAVTEQIPALIEVGKQAGDPYSSELRTALDHVRDEAMKRSPLSPAEADFLARCIDWDMPAYAAKPLVGVAAEVIRLTGGLGLASLHTITGDAPNPRAGYGGLDVGYLSRPRDLWHEMFHHVEYALPDGFEHAWSFVQSRSTHEEPRPLHQLSPDLGFPPDLMGYDAPMIHPYAAVVKPERRATEVLSMGGEHLMDAEAMSDLAVKDILHLRFTLGLLLASR